MKECIDKMEEAFAALGRGEVESPLRTRIAMSDLRNILFMPSLIRGSLNTLSLKVVSVYPDIGPGKPSLSALVAVIDGSDGAVRALIEGATLTSIRTGAVSGLSCRYLARKGSETLGMIGAGGQAFQQVNAVHAEAGIGRVRIFSLEHDRSLALAERCRRELGIEATVCEDAEKAIEGTDVIVTATTSKVPVFDGRKVREGTHVVSMGAYTPDAREMDSAFASRASIFVDSKEAALEEAGDILIPMKEGAIASESIKGDLAGLVMGRVRGRVSNSEITWFKSVGLAFEDNIIGWLLYQKALAKSVGSWIQL